MKQLLLTILLTITATTAFAMTDYKCMDDCNTAGYMYGYCQKLCEY